MANVVRVLAALAVVSVALTACGKRGTLEAPDVAEDKAAVGRQAADNGGKKAAKSEDQQTFVLDPLLR